jgi:outer membrane receptor protein involved in Fe transport
MLAAEYSRQDPLRAGDRDFAFAAHPDTTLLPEQLRKSVFGSIRQDLTDTVSVFGNVLYTKRDSEHEKFLVFPEVLHDRQTAENKQLTGLLGLRLDTDNWNGELVANHSVFSFDSELNRGGELTTTDVDTDVTSVDARINGAIARVPAGDISVAVGAGYRRENINTIFDDVLPTRNVHIAFGELFLPIVGKGNRMPGIEALELSVAARYEKFSDFGSKTTPKYGLRWSPMVGLALRGTYGKSFKAPTLAQLAGGNESFLAFIPSDFGFTVPGDPLVLARTQAAHPDLHAEESTSWTAGIDVQPGNSPFKLSVSYYDIDMTGRITDPLIGGFDAFFNNPDAFGDLQVRDPSAEFINQLLAGATSFLDLTGGVFSPDGVGLFADFSLTNLASEHQSGVDLETSYLFDTQWGQFDASLHATYITKFEKAVTSATPVVNARNVLYNPVDLRVRGGGTWSRGAWTTSLFVNYADDYRVSDEPESPEIDSWTTFDANVRYAPEASESTFWHGLSLTFSVRNLFNRNPPYVATPVFLGSNPGYDPTNADPQGRFIALAVSKSW